ncbi:MAG: GNAT family N-acetyltransferase [Saprospiraceae bacterium]|nr:GNAT family N-acetyltransferase [Saprospiraceae bacterium]
MADLSRLQEVGRATYVPYYPHIWKPGGLEWYMEKCFGKEVLQIELNDPNLVYWLAESDAGETIGFLKTIARKSPPPGVILPEKAFYLEKIYLMPAYFGKGIGQELLQFAKNKALQAECNAIWLMVMKSGPVKAYEKAGFQKIGEVYWDFAPLKEHERGGWAMLCNLEQL